MFLSFLDILNIVNLILLLFILILNLFYNFIFVNPYQNPTFVIRICDSPKINKENKIADKIKELGIDVFKHEHEKQTKWFKKRKERINKIKIKCYRKLREEQLEEAFVNKPFYFDFFGTCNEDYFRVAMNFEEIKEISKEYVVNSNQKSE